MHGLLAVSALHYAQHYPNQRKEYILISSHYQNLALKMFTVKLQDINEDNIEPYFYLATFIFILSLCSIAERQDSPSPVTPGEIAQSFSLLQGAKSIYEFKSTDGDMERRWASGTACGARSTPSSACKADWSVS